MFLRIFLLVCLVVSFTDAHIISGGVTTITNSTVVQELVDKVMAFYNEIQSDPNYYISVKVLEATSQVVAGALFRLKLNIGRTDCSKILVTGPAIKLCKLEQNAVIKELNAQNWVLGDKDQITFEL